MLTSHSKHPVILQLPDYLAPVINNQIMTSLTWSAFFSLQQTLAHITWPIRFAHSSEKQYCAIDQHHISSHTAAPLRFGAFSEVTLKPPTTPNRHSLAVDRANAYLGATLNQQVCPGAQSCLTLCDPLDYSLPGSSVHGIFQARVLEWVAISFSKEIGNI